PLQLNAPGTTATHALLTGSIAIDKALDCTDLSTPAQPVLTDQRGVSRPQGAACDVGAFEAQAPAVMINNLIATIQGYNLAKGIENSLLVKLNAALAALAVGDSLEARGNLGAFLNQVQAQRDKALTPAQADELTAAANAILALL